MNISVEFYIGCFFAVIFFGVSTIVQWIAFRDPIFMFGKKSLVKRLEAYKHEVARLERILGNEYPTDEAD